MSARALIEAVIGKPSALYAKPAKGEHVVAAAVRYAGDVYLGDCHGDAEDLARAKGFEPRDPAPGEPDFNGRNYGFYTSRGRFVSREMAFKLAKRCSQMSCKGTALDGHDGELDSAELEHVVILTTRNVTGWPVVGKVKGHSSAIAVSPARFTTNGTLTYLLSKSSTTTSALPFLKEMRPRPR